MLSQTNHFPRGFAHDQAYVGAYMQHFTVRARKSHRDETVNADSQSIEASLVSGKVLSHKEQLR